MAHGLNVKKESDGSAAGSIRSETTGSRVWTLPDKDGTVAQTFNRYITGATHDRYMFPMMKVGVNNGTGALAANVARAVDFQVEHEITLDRIAIEITAGTGNIRLGIWNTDSTGYPTTLVVDSGQIVVGSAGVKTATINTTLLPGLYWIGYCTDTALTARVMNVNTAAPTIFGAPSSSFNLAGVVNMWSVAYTYGALGSFPAGATIANVTIPLIGVRIA